MFTGIITNTGIVFQTTAKRRRTTDDARLPDGQGRRTKESVRKLFIRMRKAFTRVKTGESIAVNGCCLTVVSCKKNVLEFDVSDETLRKTTLSHFRSGDVVNLERALRAGDRFGGHFVLGHVDGVGRVRAIKKNPGSVCYTISYPKKFSRLLIEKGSVAVDGISLTVCDLTRSAFNVYVIPHTLKETHLVRIKTGDAVNLEFDVLGKYALRVRSPF